MKRIIVLMMVFTTLFMACKKKESSVKQGEVVFGVNRISNSLKKATSAEPALIVIDIKDSNGSYVYQNHEIALYEINGSYFSSALTMDVGTYQITNFLIESINGDIIYASPLEGSNLEYLVNNALPINFIVDGANAVTVAPEVIDVSNYEPQDFGYASFQYTLNETFKFRVSVFAFNELTQLMELTSADVLVLDGVDTLVELELESTINTVLLRDNQASYALNVLKDGFATYNKTFIVDSLKTYDTVPLKIELITVNSIFGTVSDIDGNEYSTVKIGESTWMSENLYVKKYNDGTEIAFVSGDAIWANKETPAYSWYDAKVTEALEKKYGIIYNDYVLKENKNVCPEGWHVSNTDDWLNLTNHLAYGGDEYAGNLNTAIARKMADPNSYWEPSTVDGAVGNYDDPVAMNQYGFNAVSAGCRSGRSFSQLGDIWTYSGVCSQSDKMAQWWSVEGDNIYYTSILYSSQNLYNSRYKAFGFAPISNYADGKSIRCVKD